MADRGLMDVSRTNVARHSARIPMLGSSEGTEAVSSIKATSVGLGTCWVKISHEKGTDTETMLKPDAGAVGITPKGCPEEVLGPSRYGISFNA